MSFLLSSGMPYKPVAYSSYAVLINGARSSSTTTDRTVRPSNSSGASLFDRWVAWVQSWMPTCAFERGFDWTYMCHRHIMLTHMYNIEVIYREAGFQLKAPADSMPGHVSIRPGI